MKLSSEIIIKERERQNELLRLRAKLKKSDERLATEGQATQTPEELLTEIKKVARDNGEL